MKFFRPYVELLEPRLVLSGIGLNDAGDHFTPVVMAGLSGSDSPVAREILANADSRLDGVGSLFLRKGNGPVGSLCTAAAIAPNFLLTAGHCVDTDDNGTADFKPNRVTFYADGDTSAGVTAKRLVPHHDYLGFSNSILNDLAVVELASNLPVGTPFYQLSTDAGLGSTVTLAGFGGSGNGDVGSTVAASLTAMRLGENVIDEILDGGNLWKADFDHPTNTALNQMGGGSLGDDTETITVQGDSGGPIFYDDAGTLKIAGTMTFGQDTAAAAFPKFGSLAGGMLMSDGYVTWINSVIEGGGGGGGGGDDGGGGGGKPKCHPKRGCTSGAVHVNAEIVLATDILANSFSGPTTDDAPTDAMSIVQSAAAKLKVASFNNDASVVDLSRELFTAEGSSAESESSDRLFSIWPGSLHALLQDEVLSA